MPWKNTFVESFDGLGLSIGFQQMKDEKSADLMRQYMYPNSRENGINGIEMVEISGPIPKKTLSALEVIFPQLVKQGDSYSVMLENDQKVVFHQSEKLKSSVTCRTVNPELVDLRLDVENLSIDKKLAE